MDQTAADIRTKFEKKAKSDAAEADLPPDFTPTDSYTDDEKMTEKQARMYYGSETGGRRIGIRDRLTASGTSESAIRRPQ